MTIEPDDRRALMDAGAAALAFNAPMDRARAQTIADRLAADGAQAIVDLGCGHGALARLVAETVPTATVIGVDTDAEAIETARHRAEAAGLGDRLRYEVADAASWSGPVDAAVCIGASHAFGSTVDLLAGLARLVPTGTAHVADGVWVAPPDEWCLETFGPQPDGPDALASLAATAGWTVASTDLSTLAEWDEFEHGWIGGVRSVGTPTATTFADQRADEYGRYRGVLGFGWLHLRR